MSLVNEFVHAPETQMTATGGAVVTYITNPTNLVFILTVALLTLQLGLALHKYYKIWQERKAKKLGLEK